MINVEARAARTIVAIDFANAQAALAFTARLEPALCRLKVGKELFTSAGPHFVEALMKQGFDVFLDLKYHDIPNTVAAACRSAAELGVWMVDVHASGGRAMMEAARNALAHYQQRPLLIGVTVLTSMNEATWQEVFPHENLADSVLHLARLAGNCGLDGVVTSAHEAPTLRDVMGRDFVLVTPGIRPTGSHQDDQSRIKTPKDAFLSGSHYLVMGRPVTTAPDPLTVLRDAEQAAVYFGQS